jgi:hypothetical protein
MVSASSMKRGWKTTGAIVAAAILAAAVAWTIGDLLRDPQVYLLVAEEGGEWITLPEKPNMLLRPEGYYSALFSVDIAIGEQPEQALLDFRTFRTGRVTLDGGVIGSVEPELDAWKKRRTLDLAPYLTPGRHLLEIKVTNYNSFPALWAVCPTLNLGTSTKWSARGTRGPRVGARSAHEFQGPAPLAHHFETTIQAFLRLWPLYLPLFAVVVFYCALCNRGGSNRVCSIRPTPSALRWILLAAWALMCGNNLVQLPGDIGFDVDAHIDYMKFIATEGRLPLASDGWEMFQSPLYYLASLPLHQFLASVTDADGVRSWLRVVPMLCALIHIEIAYRAMLAVFPGRADLQGLGLLIAALLPMNLFLSQTVGNESTSAMLTGFTVLVALRVLPRSETPAGRRVCLLLGGVWGLALLAKSTAAMLAPAVAIALVHRNLGDNVRLAEGGRALLKAVGFVFVTAFVVAGWFYLRNWIELGKPVHVGWDPAMDITWWQDPGFRTPEYLLSFGTSVVQPVNAVYYGFWDAVYSTLWSDGLLASRMAYEGRPPWNYSFMLAGTLLAIVPTALLGVGAIRALAHPKRALANGTLISVVCLATYLVAMMYFYVRIPLYSVTKASVTMGLAACYGILVASGFDVANRIRGLGPVLWGLFVLWAVSAYAAFFVVAV